eukprot:226190-Chlamydomonas_euryale.AAC.1
MAHLDGHLPPGCMVHADAHHAETAFADDLPDRVARQSPESKCVERVGASRCKCGDVDVRAVLREAGQGCGFCAVEECGLPNARPNTLSARRRFPSPGFGARRPSLVAPPCMRRRRARQRRRTTTTRHPRPALEAAWQLLDATQTTARRPR